MKMNNIIIVLIMFMVTLNIVNNQSVPEENDKKQFEIFEEFMGQHQKAYKSVEEMIRRFEIFKTNYAQMLLITDKEDNNEEKVGLSTFMDLTEEEFQQIYLTLNQTEVPQFNETVRSFKDASEEEHLRFLQTATVPLSFDWRAKGATTAVKNQGSYCGSCWSFTAIETIESQIFIKTGKLPTLSVQQLVDCDYNNYGCQGGTLAPAFNYVTRWGIQSASSYPYQWTKGTCRYNQALSTYKISGYYYSGTTDEENIKEMLFKYGPLAITINASILQYYNGGVMNVPYSRCPYNPNHGVVIEGYGTTALGLNYWIIRNSWGRYWGENGYFRIARGRSLCGLNQNVLAPYI